MSAIVIVFIPTRDGQQLTEQAATVHGLDILRQGDDTDNTRTNPRKVSGRDQAILPFWTWFIENQRSCGA